MCGAMYASFIIILCGQYDILYTNLKNLGEVNSRVLNEKSKEIVKSKQLKYDFKRQELKQYLVSTEKLDNIELDGKMYKDEMETLADCVKHHEIILEFSKQLQDVYSIFTSSKLFYSSELFFIT